MARGLSCTLLLPVVLLLLLITHNICAGSMAGYGRLAKQSSADLENFTMPPISITQFFKYVHNKRKKVVDAGGSLDADTDKNMQAHTFWSKRANSPDSGPHSQLRKNSIEFDIYNF